MNSIEKNKKVTIACFLASGMFIFGFGSAFAATEIGPDPSLLTPEIEQEIEEYSLGVVADSTFGGTFTETLPFHTDRFTQFSLDFRRENRKGYQPGERLDVAGNLSFNPDVENAYLDFKKECLGNLSEKNKSRCLLSPNYFFNEYSQLGLFVQVWRKDKEEKASLNGDYLVDEFYVLEGVSLKKNDLKTFSVNWKIPTGMKKGEYYLTFSVLANKNFELSGTPLLASALKQIYNFEIGGEEENISSLEIDKNALRINDVSYNYRSPAPEITPLEKDDSVSIEIPVINEGGEKKVSLYYELYKWGQTDPKNLIEKKEESRVFKPNEKAIFNYKFVPTELESVYNLRVTAKTETSQSISNIRFTIKNHDKGIFRFLALAEDRGNHYPFFCLKNANWGGLFQGQVEIEVKDSLGNLVGQFSEKANIRPETRCFIALDAKINSTECLALKGKILNREGKLTDEKEILIPCGSIKESKLGGTLKKIGENLPFKENKGWTLIFVFILFILGGTLIYLNNKKKNNEN